MTLIDRQEACDVKRDMQHWYILMSCLHDIKPGHCLQYYVHPRLILMYMPTQ